MLLSFSISPYQVKLNPRGKWPKFTHTYIHTHTHKSVFCFAFFSKLIVLVHYYSFPLSLSDAFQFFSSFLSYCQQEDLSELPTLRKQNHRIKYFWFSTKGLLWILDTGYWKI